ncbi:MAG: hypothetical protein RMN25_05910 [Anaerolineae bacterium]|nr:Uma2 family endonuclease [Thermoflexales bacterium]MDW8407301.1 hypothetical protein [Anaerolineae bacterium]
MAALSPQVSVLQAKLQAWCVSMLSLVVDAYDLGAVIGKGAVVQAGGQNLTPDVLFVSKSQRAMVGADAIHGPPALCIDIIYRTVPEPERESLRQRYASIQVVEYWQIEADTGQAALYQASATWSYDLIPPDKAGMHFSSAIVELSFPVRWFREQPSVWRIMQAWGMIRD